MSGKQNFIFFLGLTLILLNFWIGGQLKVLSKGIFQGTPNGKATFAIRIPTPLNPFPIEPGGVAGNGF